MPHPTTGISQKEQLKPFWEAHTPTPEDCKPVLLGLVELGWLVGLGLSCSSMRTVDNRFKIPLRSNTARSLRELQCAYFFVTTFVESVHKYVGCEFHRVDTRNSVAICVIHRPRVILGHGYGITRENGGTKLWLQPPIARTKQRPRCWLSCLQLIIQGVARHKRSNMLFVAVLFHWAAVRPRSLLFWSESRNRFTPFAAQQTVFFFGFRSL